MSTDRSAVVKDACDRARAALRNGEVAGALRYFEYAQRLAPSDAEVTMAIGAARLSLQDARATESFTLVATRDDVQEAWLGLAAAHHGMGEHDLAARDLRMLLSRHGHLRGTDNVRLHDAITAAHDSAGWCALSADGRLRVSLLNPAANMNRVLILLDGAPLGVRPNRCTRDGEALRALYLLPDAWRHAVHISGPA